MLCVPLREVEPLDDENLVQVSQRLLIQWLLQVEEEGEKDV